MTSSSSKATVVTVSGPSNGGKTTLIELLIPRLRKRDLSVGTVKHAHKGFEIDHRGKDSWRHTKAGSQATALIGPTQYAIVRQSEEEISCQQAIEMIAPVLDLVLVEGFKMMPGRKIVIDRECESRLDIGPNACRIGIFPADLNEDELELVAAFCSEWSSG